MTPISEHEHDEHDPYLWQRDGAPAPEIVALEQQLRPLAWVPRELAVPSVSSELAPVIATKPKPGLRVQPTRPRSGVWVPALAGLAAAAAVLGAIWLGGGPSLEATTPTTRPQVEPIVEPAGRPSPDLRDPFADDTHEGVVPFTAPTQPPVDLVDPFAVDAGQPEPRKTSPDLKDPFSPSSSPSPKPAPSAPKDPFSSPSEADLVDPFHDGEREPRPSKPSKKPSKLDDPFGGNSSKGSPDLADPFSR